MRNRSSKMKRRTGTRSYRHVFFVATEGSKTEPQYFGIFNSENISVCVKCLLHHTKNSPRSVLSRMKNFLKKNGLKRGDEAWIVVDRDSWSESDLDQLYNWSVKNVTCFGLAVSNPQFEYWLLLHFEEGNNVTSKKICINRLKTYLPDYGKKQMDISKFRGRITEAVKRAKQRDNPPCEKWPSNTGTTVYRLVERILS